MGFFSFKCSKSNISVPAYPYAGLPLKASQVVMVLPDNSILTGVYDGYGRIGGKDIYDTISPFMSGENTNRDWIFNDTRYIHTPRGVFIKSVDQFNWDDAVIGLDGGEYSLNELRQRGYIIKSNFNLADDMIKIVRADKYKGEKFDVLPPSQPCPDQGFFYGENDVSDIKESL